jgi:orotate phosphoribosyltransferase
VKDYQLRFIKLAIESKALQFGDFTLKSGRNSPYFFNASALLSFGHISELSEILLLKTKDLNIEFDMIFGPAYKGIFLGSLLAAELSKQSSMPVCFNRKEVKDHGEGGSLIGAAPNGRVLIIDDVLSSGLAITEACDYLAPFDADIAGALVTLNRQEKGQDSDQMAADELRAKGTEIFQIISLDDLINAESLIDKTNLIKMQEYREIYQGA